jgi:class 3 adenylate cyclase
MSSAGKRFLSNSKHQILNGWDKLITIGISNELSDWEKKRSRLLNGICWMSFFILTVYCSMYLDYEHRLTFWESFAGLVASAVPIILNYFKKHNAAAHFFCLYNLFSYTFQSISHGVVDAAEYILIASSIASMLFFRNRLTVVLYFVGNAIAFFLCKYSFTVMQPFLFMPPGENLFVANHITMFVIVFLIVFYFKVENERQENMLEVKNVNLTKEKQKSDNLLLNILPEEVAEELKTKGSADAKHFEQVTVMFTDFKGFTKIAEKLSPSELVSEIHECFRAFDYIISKHNIEKIKTIGDAYMCAGGLPVENKTHAADVVNAALEIQQFMQEHLEQRKKQNKEVFEIRIGIHTGTVVAGIVGVKKFAYDIWGDTVNIASRMESSGEAGKVNISGTTYELVKEKFTCTHRGKVSAKNKGEIDMYYVEQKN